MPNGIRTAPRLTAPPVPAVVDDIPILYEDEDEGDMGEANLHVVNDETLHICVGAHLASKPGYGVFSNLNLYYRNGPPHSRTGSLPYVSPDTMVVKPYQPLPRNIKSYTIGREGPPPVLVAEILSERSAQQRDMDEKPVICAKLRVAEYILVDPTGDFLPQRLLLKRLQSDLTWHDEQDADGGVTSQLGFRLIWDTDGGLRVVNSRTGKPYIRPNEIQSTAEAAAKARRTAERTARAEAKARKQAEDRIRTLEEELSRLRRTRRKLKDS